MYSTKKAVFFIILIVIQSHGSYARWEEPKKEAVSEECGDTLLVFGLKTAVLAGTAIMAAPVAVAAAGFGATGVAAGTAAALVQSAWFGGAITGLSGAAFAGLQSIGAAGLGLGAKAAIVAASSAAIKTYEKYTCYNPKDDECNTVI